MGRIARLRSASPAPRTKFVEEFQYFAPLRGVPFARFWRAIEREADWLPELRDLLRVHRRLEARGEIRGVRFVAGFSSEQFALPDAVGLLRETKRNSGSGDWVSLLGADPLNLVGILTPGQKLAALTGNDGAIVRREPATMDRGDRRLGHLFRNIPGRSYRADHDILISGRLP
jgi:hypothetical protein